MQIIILAPIYVPRGFMEHPEGQRGHLIVHAEALLSQNYLFEYQQQEERHPYLRGSENGNLKGSHETGAYRRELIIRMISSE